MVCFIQQTDLVFLGISNELQDFLDKGEALDEEVRDKSENRKSYKKFVLFFIIDWPYDHQW